MIEKSEIQLANLFCGNGFAICALLGELVKLCVPIAIHCVDMNGEALQVACLED